MASNDTIKKTIQVTLALCIVCSVVVSTAAVMLRPAQLANQELDFKSNILAAAGLLDAERGIEEVFDQRITVRVVDLETGEFTDEIDPQDYDQHRAARDPARSKNLTGREDIAGISRRERYSEVYWVEDEQGELETIIIPVRGYGLWSTLYGLLALEPDGRTVVGLTFYEHAETPGLGGEVDNPNWRAQWPGKEVYDEDGNVAITVVKGSVDADDPERQHKVDGLAGATLTARGVQNLLRFWLGDMGFKPFLTNLREGDV